ncbi:MAG: hypothetical protein QM610_15150 [Chitinophagaceae bacterium]
MKKTLKAILFFLVFSLGSTVTLYARIDSTKNATYDIRINTKDVKTKINDDFIGLSFELNILTRHQNFLNKNNVQLVNLFKNLGKGVLRIGGGSSDLISWKNIYRDKNTPTNVITKTDIDNLKAFADAIGWKVLININIEKFDPNAAAQEAQYIVEKMGESLYGVQFGNEPDIYKNSSFEKYSANWSKYYDVVSKYTKKIAGPDVGSINKYFAPFAAKHASQVFLLDAHYYQDGPASKDGISMNTIINSSNKSSGYLGRMKSIASQYKRNYRISECNSIFGGGKANVSDAFGSALWGLNFMWDVAENNGAGVNFHCHYNLAYSAIGFDPKVNGQLIVHPLYYALLAFRQGAKGRLVSYNKPKNLNQLDVHASIENNKCYITIINKYPYDVTLALKFPEKVNNYQVNALSAPSLGEKTNTRFANIRVSQNGAFSLKNINATSKSNVNSSTSVPLSVKKESALIVICNL